jgi:allantoinase
MGDFDLVVRDGIVVTPAGLLRADVGISEGSIAALGANLSPGSATVIHAEGLHLFPGVIDAHVHFNDPGRADWEGFETGSRALAAGGATMFFDMPLNSQPPTIDGDSFGLKLKAAERQSLVDFAFWGGLVPRNLDRLGQLADCGVVGFKAFMADSGMDDFPCVDDRTLHEGMKRAAHLQLPVAVHAESEAITRQLAQQSVSKGQTSFRDFLSSRPVEAELEAIRRALDMAGDTGCVLHVVHISCGEGVRLVAEARRRGVKVSCETCPHYLVLTEDDVERLGAVAKCAPPLRSASHQELLWNLLLAGEVTTVGSDHSPSLPEMKQDSNFFKVWGGIPGGQHTLPLLLTEGHFKRGASLSLIAALLSVNVARQFGLPPRKGQFAVGSDADFALVDLRSSFSVKEAELLSRHRQTPYLGRPLRGEVKLTCLRGQTVFKDGKIVARPSGHLVKPFK